MPRPGTSPGHLLLVASSELPMAFYTGTLTASLGILIFSVLLWLVLPGRSNALSPPDLTSLKNSRARSPAKRTTPCGRRAVTTMKSVSLAEAFNTMLSRIEAREQQLKRARDDSQAAYDQAQGLAEETRHTNRKLELEVQVRSKIEKKLTGFRTTSTASSTPCPRR